MKQCYKITLLIIGLLILVLIIPVISYFKANKAKDKNGNSDLIDLGYKFMRRDKGSISLYKCEYKFVGINFGSYVIKQDLACPISVTNGLWIGSKCVYINYSGYDQEDYLRFFPQ